MSNIKYHEADEVQSIAAELIPKHHSHLKSANIAYLFRNKAQKNGNMIVLGNATKSNATNKTLHGFDFIITIAEDLWDLQSEEKKKIQLVDHELCHCYYKIDKNGDTIWILIDHDIKEFRDILVRYGLEDYQGVETVVNSDDE